jgi:hypothetical protein
MVDGREPSVLPALAERMPPLSDFGSARLDRSGSAALLMVDVDPARRITLSVRPTSSPYGCLRARRPVAAPCRSSGGVLHPQADRGGGPSAR